VGQLDAPAGLGEVIVEHLPEHVAGAHEEQDGGEACLGHGPLERGLGPGDEGPARRLDEAGGGARELDEARRFLDDVERQETAQGQLVALEEVVLEHADGGLEQSRGLRAGDVESPGELLDESGVRQDAHGRHPWLGRLASREP